MKTDLQIVYKNMEASDSVEERVKAKVEKLEQYYDRIVGCHVTIEAPTAHHRKGGVFKVRIDLTVPDKEIVVSKAAEQDHSHEDAFVAIRDAFEAAKRQLQDYSRIRKGEVKHHEKPMPSSESNSSPNTKNDSEPS